MKIILEYNEEDKDEALKAMQVNDISCVIWELQKYRRELSKGYINNTIVVNGNKVLDEETISKQAKQSYAKELCPEEVDESLPLFKNNKEYVWKEDVLNRVDAILDMVRNFLD